MIQLSWPSVCLQLKKKSLCAQTDMLRYMRGDREGR